MTAWQPLHTVYVPADRVTASTVAEHGHVARDLLDRHAGDVATLAEVFDLDVGTAARTWPRVAQRLEAAPVEDLRVDFEDGYGVRDEREEDDHAAAAGRAAGGLVVRRVGLRVKSYTDGHAQRAVRTLHRFLSALVDAADGDRGPQLVVTLPKVERAGDVGAFAGEVDRIERRLGLARMTVRLEMQIETPSALLDRDGRVPLRGFVDAAGGRMSGAHFGVYDYTAALGLPAAEQRLRHPACDAARDVMQVALADGSLELSDGSTVTVPADDTTPAVHAAWRAHAADVRHSLAHGWWQSWDMHPAQLVSRFAAVHAFHLATLDDHVARVAAWHTATASGGVLDEPATVRTLLGQLRRAVDAGAVDEAEVLDRCGIDAATLRGARV